MVTLAYDEFLRELEEDKGSALWLAHLSDGSTVYQDDGRPGVEGTAWSRLRSYLLREGLQITDLGLKFRDHVERGFLPPHLPAYYFSRAMMADLTGGTSHFYLLGGGQGGKLVLTRWHVPELIHVSTEVRDLPSPGTPAYDSLLTNPALPLE